MKLKLKRDYTESVISKLHRIIIGVEVSAKNVKF